VYIPKHFEVVDDNEVYAFIEQNAFGQLVSTVEGRLFTTHLPFLLSEDRTQVTGHLALQNPQHIELDGQDVLVTLTGAHDYISPSWYSSPGVPTWNYQAVHLYGNCRLFRDVDKLKALVDTLTNTYEKAFAQPWQPDFSNSMLGAIVGVEILIDEIQCKYKLSQNRSSQDRAQVIERLQSIGSIKLSEAMARNEL
jgi:transcriptional regulator